MTLRNPLHEHRATTRALALQLRPSDVYHWLVQHGYFPENYVLPPCFCVRTRPPKRRVFFKRTRKYTIKRCEIVQVHFPRTELTDRHFGIMDPEIHNDIAYNLSTNWKSIVKAIVPSQCAVVSYGFPIPINAKTPGRVGHLRSGRMIYEFLTMAEDDVASVAYRYSHIVRTDIKRFYPSIYTHSIAWALHGKKTVRKRLSDYKLLGNRLDKLFQYANDGCTNGVPIGPVVSDIAAEIIASAVDRAVSKSVQKNNLDCEIVRFKDDYRILANSETDGRTIVKHLQAALRAYNLDLNEGKTSIHKLPEGLFRDWVSLYHAVHPRKRRQYRWKEFRELYLAVLKIDEDCPGTGVIDRFLADIVSRNHRLKVDFSSTSLQKVVSMLLLMARRRAKSFPKVLALIEAVLRSPYGDKHRDEIVAYLERYLINLSKDESRNKYLIAWLSYFLVSNRLKGSLAFKPKFRDPITRSVFNNRGLLFRDCKDHSLFEGSVTVGNRVSMLEHLDVFDPPGQT